MALKAWKNEMRETYLQWLDASDEEQSKWALQHLVRKQLIEQPKKEEAPGIQLKGMIGFLHSALGGLSEADLVDLDNKMKQAWATEKHRRTNAKKGIKPQFIDMDNETRSLLARLCTRKNLTIKEVIADLVSREYTLERDAKHALKEAKQAIQDKALKRQARFTNKEKDRKLSILEKELESTWKRVSNLAFEMCASQLLAQSGSVTNQLTPEQESEARTNAEALTKALREHPAKPAIAPPSEPSDNQLARTTTTPAPPTTRRETPEAPPAALQEDVDQDPVDKPVEPQSDLRGGVTTAAGLETPTSAPPAEQKANDSKEEGPSVEAATPDERESRQDHDHGPDKPRIHATGTFGRKKKSYLETTDLEKDRVRPEIDQPRDSNDVDE